MIPRELRGAFIVAAPLWMIAAAIARASAAVDNLSAQVAATAFVLLSVLCIAAGMFDFGARKERSIDEPK
jgi:membrane protein implicated in regulation of membrane protease activity